MLRPWRLESRNEVSGKTGAVQSAPLPNCCIMNTRMGPILKGSLSFIPGVKQVFLKKNTGGTNSAKYCYDVWLKHLTMLWENGMRSIPATLAELGPGDSLGIGLAAVLSGVDTYFALDVVKFSNTDFNIRIFDELTALFRERAPGPAKGWPDCDRYLDENHFPSHILTEDVLGASLSEERVSRIRKAIMEPESSHGGITVKYIVPWLSESVIDRESADVIISHAVLEHVVDLDETYRALHAWLKAGGTMSNQIDFSSHGLSGEWNGFRAYPEWVWKLIVGKRAFLLNRQPHSVHMALMEKNRFKILCDLKHYRREGGIRRSQLSSRWRDISDDDLTISSVFIQARK